MLIFLCSLACNTESKEKADTVNLEKAAEIPFDKNKWRVKEGIDYPYRDQMLNDIVYKDSVRMLDEDEILEMLGKPDKRNDGYLYYMIAQKRLGYWALHTKTLVIKFSKDSTIDWIKIHE